MSDKVEELKIKFGNKSFTEGTYNGIAVIFNDDDGFINATEMCNQFNKKFRKILETHSWQEYFKTFCRENSNSQKMGGWSEDEFMYRIHQGIPDKYKFLRGIYVDPRLINYIAIWASPTYAVYVGKIMDSINDKVHDTLEKEHLHDTVENAKTVFIDVAKQIAPKIKPSTLETQCWCCRDNVHLLDQFEKDELQKC